MKPVLIEALRWPGSLPPLSAERREINAFLGKQDARFHGGVLQIHTRQDGTLEAQPGDWIVKDATGECYPVPKDVFEATYEPAE